MLINEHYSFSISWREAAGDWLGNSLEFLFFHSLHFLSKILFVLLICPVNKPLKNTHPALKRIKNHKNTHGHHHQS